MKILRRNLSLMLALRYLNPLRAAFSVITLICLLGVSLGVAVVIVVLSVMEGLQQQVEERVLAFEPHFSITAENALGAQTLLREEEHNWPDLQEKIAALPSVTAVYPLIRNDAFVQSNTGRMTCRFNSIEAKNDSQIAPLTKMLKAGTFDFGEGFNEECVISATTAKSLKVGIGDMVHLTPVGSLDEVAAVWSMIQHPLPTHENTQFMEDISLLFESEQPSAQRIARIMESIDALFAEGTKMRASERELCDKLYQILLTHTQGQSFTPEESISWKETVQELTELDRDKEDGKAVKDINELVMPVDLEIIGIYQPPANMPGPNIYMPVAIAQQVMGYGVGGDNPVQALCVRIESAGDIAPMQTKLQQVLPQSTALNDEELLGTQWTITPWTENFKQFYEMMANERVMMSFVLSIISLIAAFCIMAVMFTMSMQRRREIAVMQALGATPWKIMSIFVWQGLIIGLVGAIVGVLLALLILYYRLDIQFFLSSLGVDPFPMDVHGLEMPAAYNPSTFIKQAIYAFVMVNIAAVIPAFFVSMQDPSKALRAN